MRIKLTGLDLTAVQIPYEKELQEIYQEFYHECRMGSTVVIHHEEPK